MPRLLIPALGVVGGLLALLLLAALVSPMLLDRERVARELEVAIGEALGSPVQIDGVSGLRLLPGPSLRLDRLVMPTTNSGLRLEAADVQLRLAARPLFNGQMVVRSLALERLLLHWAAPMTERRVTLTARTVEIGPIADDRPGQVRAQVRIDGTAPDLAGDLTLDAEFRYTPVAADDPARSDAGDQHAADDQAAGQLTLAPLRLHGADLVLGNAHGVALDLTAAARFEPSASVVEVTDLALAMGTLQLTGTALLRPEPAGLALSGTLALAPFDLRDWLQRHVDERGPSAPHCLRRVAFETAYRWQFTAAQRTLELTQGRLLVDSSQAALTARLAWPAGIDDPMVAGERGDWPWTSAGAPVGAVAAAIDRVDLDTCLAAAPTGTGQDASAASGPIDGMITAVAPTTGPSSAPTQAPGRVELEGSDHWVGTPTPPDLPLPTTTDTADPALTWRLEAGQLRLGGLAYEAPVVVASTGRDGVVFDLTAALYGGPLVARLTWEPPQAAPAGQTPGPGSGTGVATTASQIALRADAAGVNVGALLADLTGQPPALTGRGTLHAALAAPVNDLARLRHALGGEVAVTVYDGTVAGVDLPRLLRLAGSVTPTPSAASDAPTTNVGTVGQAIAATAFASLSASATGADGRFVSHDISGHSPYLDLIGTGQIDLPSETLALDLTARLRRPPDGSGIRELEDLPIPVTLTGPWVAPQWQVDHRAVLAELARRALDRQGGDLLQDLEDRIGIPGLREGLEQGLRGLFGR